jgi:hypothetical protein
MLLGFLYVRLGWIVKLFGQFLSMLFCRRGLQRETVLFGRPKLFIALTAHYRLLYHQLFKKFCIYAPSLLRGCIYVNFCSQIFTLRFTILLLQIPSVLLNAYWLVSVEIQLLLSVRPRTLNWGIPWFNEFPWETSRIQVSSWLDVGRWVTASIDQTWLVSVKLNWCLATVHLLTPLYIDFLIVVPPDCQLRADHIGSRLRCNLLKG